MNRNHPDVGPFERHLRDAIALNESRAGFYASMSDGASFPVTRRLIRIERMLLPVARWMDRRASRYHAAGIPLMEAVFAPMHAAPPPGTLPPTCVTARALPTVLVARRDVREAYRDGGFGAARRAIDRHLAELQRGPAVDCMVRHLLESARRVADLAPVHAAQAEALDLPSPLWISGLLLRLHLLGLTQAARLDAQAYPLQCRGIPILSSDLPAIPEDSCSPLIAPSYWLPP